MEDIFIGRARDHCRIVVDAPWISNRHMRLYSIDYDGIIEPFLYIEDLSSQGNNTWLYKRDKHWERIVMSKGSIILLSHGDRIRLCDGTVFAFRSAHLSQAPSRPAEEDELRALEKDSFRNLYHITERQLGAGGTASVFMAVDRWNKKQVASKIIRLKKPGSDQTVSNHFQIGNRDSMAGIEVDSWISPRARLLRQEVHMLKTMNHPNIIQLQRVFYTKYTLYLIEDLVTGGDLASYIDQERQLKGAVDGEDACGIVYQILQALSYLHQKGVAHRDLKPENVLLSVPQVGARVVLTDFGGAAGDLKSRPRRLNTCCGTADWMAPEVTRETTKGYTIAVDMWSVGCVITALFTGSSIFANGSEENVRLSTAFIKTAAAECDLSALDTSPTWQNVHSGAKDLTKALLILDEKKRLTTKEALQHNWFRFGHRNIVNFYKTVVSNWKPSPPADEYFEEDLKVFIQAAVPKGDKRRRVLSYASPPSIHKSGLLAIPTSSVLATKGLTNADRGILEPVGQASQTPVVRKSSFIEPDEFAYGPGGRRSIVPAKKRKSTVETDLEDRALRTKAWAGNRGLMSAKIYKHKIAEKRNEAASNV